MKFSEGRRRGAEITLTPLIDILFIVLLFLVLTATFTEQTVLRIALPRAATGEPTAEPLSVVRLLIDAEGQITLDGRVQTLDEIGTRLHAIAAPDSARVTIAADRAASHGRVVQVLDLVRQAGIVRVEFQTLAATPRGFAR